MKAISTKFSDVKILVPTVHTDSRGHFYESYNSVDFDTVVGKVISFKQDNQSRSKKDVIRGLHYQLHPNAQGKLVRVLKGEVLDVIVDIRAGSKTLGHWFSINLSDVNNYQLWIPEGYAHGFLALTDDVEIFYKTTAYYHPESERTIKWDDPDIGINWGIDTPIISSKDDNGCLFKNADYIEI
ncbi:dTDP-4-dehydrorhamnose 3,5-epimerase [Citrobacter werkmanii]|uniref:dTDP-4-dehydrorhamnose 3,5-epimerase n=1 Tax=Citrobacter youngae TaxID=133448 RepID=A0A2Z4BVM2_9ENTR|nr:MULTISPECIES: dTDP-4-dehydrorhamnose 3,5-epimerase [Citrobacter]AWU66716.1 dTDP-4-keto-6-deoxy-D-glucose3,5-epimerase [Citrobacter youngae]ATF49046.1 dTDP-4-dehydrorhamnose 3,5-epimerase [Citrobacter werkmanii]EJB8473508.1 dTDP-4-dehydrorhamnose 3,5-epimerase [Citrobacter freundii]EJB8559653.1 dTDP-4-dehydrorhamnose 3,5-epimerase [Citrobacter freundii]QLO04746.1 dTDP-4-dehydrorhamnose 3,5-epimerase [Citrobacter freundii]